MTILFATWPTLNGAEDVPTLKGAEDVPTLKGAEHARCAFQITPSGLTSYGLSPEAS
jgi:hypothetical protein